MRHGFPRDAAPLPRPGHVSQPGGPPELALDYAGAVPGPRAAPMAGGRHPLAFMACMEILDPERGREQALQLHEPWPWWGMWSAEMYGIRCHCYAVCFFQEDHSISKAEGH